MVRMVYDEPVRYKLSQLVGNLALMNIAGCQGIPVGHITAFNASPALQLEFVKALIESVKQEDVVSLEQVVVRQEEYFKARAGKVVQRAGISRGAGDMADGSRAVVETELLYEVDESDDGGVDAAAAGDGEGEEEGEGEADEQSK